MPIDPHNLPDDAKALRKMVVDLTAQLDRESTERSKLQSLIRELIDARNNRKTEKLSKELLALFEAAWQAKAQQTEQTEQDKPVMHRRRNMHPLVSFLCNLRGISPGPHAPRVAV